MNVRPLILLWVVAIVATILAGPRPGIVGAGAAPEILLIVPSVGIGPARIGMTSAQLRGLAPQMPCEVDVTYASGRAIRLETNCGVAYQTAEGITVGLGGSRVRRIYGAPDDTVADNRPPGTRAEWHVYDGHGIAFRLIATGGDTLIQAIAIFRGTGATRRPAPAPSIPPPGPLD